MALLFILSDGCQEAGEDKEKCYQARPSNHFSHHHALLGGLCVKVTLTSDSWPATDGCLVECLVNCLPNGWANNLVHQNAVHGFLYHIIVACHCFLGSYPCPKLYKFLSFCPTELGTLPWRKRGLYYSSWLTILNKSLWIKITRLS